MGLNRVDEDPMTPPPSTYGRSEWALAVVDAEGGGVDVRSVEVRVAEAEVVKGGVVEAEVFKMEVVEAEGIGMVATLSTNT